MKRRHHRYSTKQSETEAAEVKIQRRPICKTTKPKKILNTQGGKAMYSMETGKQSKGNVKNTDIMVQYFITGMVINNLLDL